MAEQRTLVSKPGEDEPVSPPARPPIYTRDFLLLFAAELMSFVAFYILLPVIPLYILNLGGTNAQVGSLLAITGLVGVVTAPLYGRALDRWSRKRIMLTGQVLNVGVALSFTFIRAVSFFALPLVGRAFGSGAAQSASRVLVFDIAPSSRRGEAISTFMLSHNMGIAFGPAVGLAILGWGGFQAPFYAAGVLLSLAFLTASRVREPKRPAPLQAGPAQAGGLRDWIVVESLFPGAVQFLLAMSYGSTISFLAVAGKARGIEHYEIFYTVYAIVVISMRILAGKLSDRYGRAAVLLPSLVSQIASLAFLALAVNTIVPLAYSLPLVLVAAVLMGTGWGVAYPMLSALTADRVEPARRGAAMGVFQALFGLGGSMGSASVGFLGGGVGFSGAFLFSAGMVCFALLLSIVMFRNSGQSMFGAGAARTAH